MHLFLGRALLLMTSFFVNLPTLARSALSTVPERTMSIVAGTSRVPIGLGTGRKGRSIEEKNGSQSKLAPIRAELPLFFSPLGAQGLSSFRQRAQSRRVAMRPVLSALLGVWMLSSAIPPHAQK